MTRLLGVLVFAATTAPALAQAANPVVILDTSHGKIKVELFADKAPATVKNFLRYVDDKFYDGTIFHRVIEDFMIQGGGMMPGLKEKAGRAPVKNESANGLSNVRGAIAVARAVNPDSGTSQFFINTKDNIFLDRAHSGDKAGYCVFGQVIDGMDVVDKIRRVRTVDRGGHANVPREDVVIRSIRRADQLLLALTGTLAVARTFTITAYVDNASPGQFLQLDLPPGLELVEGKHLQPLAPSSSGSALVLWKARATRSGHFDVSIRSASGMVQTKKITIADRR